MNKEELKKYGIKLENLRENKFYEANIIVQSFGKEDDNESRYLVTPLNYMTRKERCCEIEYNLSDKDQKEEFLRHLRDSQERLKILSLLLHKQEEEIIEFGYPKTTCYYPEPSEESDPIVESEYRPFMNLEECRSEMEKHKPFGGGNKMKLLVILFSILILSSCTGENRDSVTFNSTTRTLDTIEVSKDSFVVNAIYTRTWSYGVAVSAVKINSYKKK